MAEFKTVIVGAQFRGPEAVNTLDLLLVGDIVELEREPDNQHDPGAVACYHAGVQIGYLPRHSNGPVGKALDAGLDVRATVYLAATVWNGKIGAAPKIKIEWQEPEPGV